METIQNLQTIYEERFSKSQPSWAQRMMNDIDIIPPTIPFVGKNYQQYKMLIYASAENLSHYKGHLEEDQIIINTKRRIVEDKVEINNRHRYYFDSEQNDNKFYPGVHCAPINDGSLTLASAYICQKLKITIDYETPKTFLECISLANFGKFSIHLNGENKRNIDYASDILYLRDSFEYVKADLLELCPEYIIIPKSIYVHNEVMLFLKQYAPQAKCFPIYQINVGNVNRIINRQYEKKALNELDSFLQEWYKHLEWSGKSKENYLAVFSYLDDIYKKIFAN